MNTGMKVVLRDTEQLEKRQAQDLQWSLPTQLYSPLQMSA